MTRALSIGYQTALARREFDGWSRSYDRSLLQRYFFEPAHEMQLNMLRPEEQDILDIGCGTGAFAARVLDRFPQARVCGLDLSDGMLGHARPRAAATGGRLQLVQGDSSRLPFADSSFDVITCTHSFHHYPRQERVIAEMYRVLRPSGRLLIIDGDRDGLWGRLIFDVLVVLMEGPVCHLPADTFRRLFREASFADVTQRRRGGPLPFLFTTGRAVKPRLRFVGRQAA